MEIAFGVFGTLLGIAGLFYAIIAHPIVVRRAETRQDSLPALATRLALFGYAPARETPEHITTFDVFYDKEYKAELVKMAGEARTRLLYEKISASRNIEFTIETEARKFIKDNQMNFIHVISSIITEYYFHYSIISKGINLEEWDLPLRIGCFATISTPNYGEIVIHRMDRISREIDPIPSWSEARDAYFVCRLLPYRYIYKLKLDDVLSRQDINIICDTLTHLNHMIYKYMGSATELSEVNRRENARLAEKMHGEMSNIMNILRQHPESRAQVCVSAELTISLAHKIIFGESDTSGRILCPVSVVHTVDHIWQRTSAKATAAAERPLYSGYPRLE